ncbi:hypothetical protein MIMGU_mgv11b019516mg [Erythranthe guttata]|uniref:Uncharacterized protein n=1 Tax=Erythranthe guttata TaxID=4155 RepID=A0A022R6M4_ERYGU|nr:hypothetical protein MIMGU_mgv11b019516mg [Erythranthe guttata]
MGEPPHNTFEYTKSELTTTVTLFLISAAVVKELERAQQGGVMVERQWRRAATMAKANNKPRAEVLALIGRAIESLRPDVQHLLRHLTTDVNYSVCAATHPTLVKNIN